MFKSLHLLRSVTFYSLGFFFMASSQSIAQVTSDGTVNTQVNQNGNTAEITGGETRGGNLFHSFQDFSVPTNNEAFFNNANDISNIFSRVTGGNISNIDGPIRANGSASLFLINPAGIIFGEGASLDIGGSFYGSSANSILFENGEFSAANLENPPLLTINAPIGLSFRDEPGDIVNRSIVQNSEEEVAGLEVTSGKNIAFIGGNLNFEGGNLTARGGNIELGGLSETGTVDITEEGSLSFPENINRADVSLSNASEVDVRNSGGGNIKINAGNLTLDAGDLGASHIRAGISSDSTLVNAQAGDITIDVSNLSLNNSGIENGVDQEVIGNSGNVKIIADSLSIINGGFVSANTSGQGNSGIVEINANDSINIDGEDSSGFSSGIFSQVSEGAVGNSGGIAITTNSLSLESGTDILASTFGQGNAGDVNIDANNSIAINGEDSSGEGSAISSQVDPEAIGNGGDIKITSKTINLNNGGEIVANTFGEGNSGNIDIDVGNDMKIDGEDSSGFPSQISSSVTAEAVGNAGDITIDTGNLSVTNGAEVSSGTRGQGSAGNINITASNSINVDGEDSDAFSSEISSSVGTSGIGNGGDVSITTDSLSLTNGGEIDTTSFNQGNAGLVKISAGDFIIVDGEGSDGSLSSINSNINGGVGDAGGVNISTDSLSVTNGGLISSSNAGQGIARLVEINATNYISIDGTTSDGFSSSIRNQVSPQAEGDSEGIKLTTSNLTVTNGGTISSASQGQGDAGLIEINATELISVDGESSDGFSSAISSQVDLGGIGNAGGVNLSTNKLSLINGGQVDSSTLAEGNAGLIRIEASDSIAIDGNGSDEVGSRIISAVGSEAMGNSEGINITTNNLNLSNGGNIQADTFGQGNAGSIEISATESISLGDEVSNSSDSSSISNRVSSGAEGDAGNIGIATGNLTLNNGAVIDASTFGNGNSGSVTIEASDSITVDGEGSNGFSSSIASSVQSLFTDAENFTLAEGNAGGVRISTTNLILTNGGRILSSSSGQGNAGLIKIEAANTVTVDGESSSGSNSNINSSINNTFFNSGEIINPIIFEELVFSEGVTINTNSLLLTNGGQVQTIVLGQGNAGDIIVNASESIIIDGKDISVIDGVDFLNGGLSSSLVGGSGSGGDINLSTPQLTIDSRGSITADDVIFGNSDSNTGQPGNISIEADSINLNDRAFIRASTSSETGNSANINLAVAENITLKNNSGISAQALQNANGGNLDIDSRFIIAFPNQIEGDGNDIVANAKQGNGGNININAESLLGIQERALNSTTNDINASSEFSLDGNVTISTPDINPVRGATELPTNVVAPEETTQQACQANRELAAKNGLNITGKGGIVPDPALFQNSLNVTVNDESNSTSAIPQPIETAKEKIQPARGIKVTESGEIILTAYRTNNAGERTPNTKLNCS